MRKNATGRNQQTSFERNPRNQREQKVYLGYIRGMAYYDAGQDTLVLMTHKNCKGEVPEQKNVQTILEDENGDLLIGTW